jgi:hypothetical protein
MNAEKLKREAIAFAFILGFFDSWRSSSAVSVRRHALLLWRIIRHKRNFSRASGNIGRINFPAEFN